MLAVRNLSYRVGKKDILQEISFTIPKGSMTGIIGPNGCGKSTLLKHLCGQIKSQGQIFFRGRALEAFSPKEIARHMAMMAQSGQSAAEGLRVKDLVLMGRYPYKKVFFDYSSHDHELVLARLQACGVSHLADALVNHLSGGEWQKVLAAKAFVQEPDILLLDEPTNHLDIEYKFHLMEQVKAFEGTSVVVLHDLNLAYQYCDYILVMKEGRIVGRGHPRDIMTPAFLKTIFNVQFYRSQQDGGEHLYY